ncbi:serine/threonine protein phosphatase [Streptomyces sp. MNU77]|uniref:PP2C family protein-serine/threonine phosphatase n=1 Tax=Streptomyces sp. MNU77 TaxID=1573406 RepID=UPI0005DBA0A9|nr:PP2C family protein-serine/threonine phosphatase [Streptomyces sp. MNU77]OLO25847.1 serine/threonine protein phosphatase [Streptomyces sp. MNU77]
MTRSFDRSSARTFAAVEPPSSTETVLGVVAVTTLVVALGVASESPVWLLGLLVFLPGTASALCTVRQTRFVAVWTTLVVTAIVLVQHPAGRRWLDNVLMVLLSLTLNAASVYACHRRLRRERDMLRLRSTAVAMQRHILRPLPVLTADVRVDGLYEPLQEDRLVGGDVYDAVETAWGTRLLIGDVQGKGIAAVGTAFAVIGAFREAAHREPDLAALVAALDSSVVLHNRYAERAGEDERFVTALVVAVDGDGAEARAVNCGHVPPYLLRDGAVSAPMLDSGVPLGLAALSDEPPVVGRFSFPAGATLLLTTDGITETRDSDGTFYPLEKRLADQDLMPSGRLARALYEDARAFAGDNGQHDDIAILTVRRGAGGQA